MEQIAKKNILCIVKGVSISITFTLVCLLILALVITYTNLEEKIIKPAIIVLTGISILIGSSIGSMKLNKNGIINGAIIGLFYFINLYLISSIIKMEFSINLQMIIITTIGIVCGTIGGIIGINKK